MKTPAAFVLACVALLPWGAAQSPTPSPPIAQERLAAVLRFLASDALAGRDSPGAGLELAGRYVADALAAAGLQPGAAEGGWFHEYTLSGSAFGAEAIEIVAHVGGRDIALRPGEDVRVWRAGRAYDGERIGALRVDVEQARALRRRLRGDAPVVLEIDPETELWAACTGRRRVLSRRRSAPWLLVREGLLPQGDLDVTLTLAAPAEVEIRLRNVVGLLPGAEKADEIVLFSSHYDHVGIGLPRDGDAIYNGADDDATGTTAVVALAEAFARRKEPLPRTLAFVCFSAEEKGLRGSRAFVADPPFPVRRIVANVNLEMLGRPWKPATAWVTGREYSDFEAIVAAGLARAGVRCEPFPMQAMLFRASDNASLVDKGVVAHSVSASSLHADYHQPGDEFAKIDLANMTLLVRGLYEVGVDLASRDEPPRYNDRGREMLERSARRRR